MEDLIKSKKRLFILDGYGQIFRSYYALFSNPLVDKNGNNVSAVYGFFNTVISILKQYKPDYFAVALDSKGKTFRHEMYPEYKSNRAKTPEDLHAQVDIIKQMMDAINMSAFAQVGMEADDIIASLCKNAEKQEIETVIITADKDLMQLVDKDTFALRPPKKGSHEYQLCKEKEVEEIFGVKPNQIVDYLTILGDTSDNVPGIDGLGEVSAVKLLQQYGSLKNAYDNLDSLSASVRKKLENAKDGIELAHTLILLKDDIYDNVDFSKTDVKLINWAEAVNQFSKISSAKLMAMAKSLAGNVSIPIQIQEEEKHFEEVQEADIDPYDNNALIGCSLKEKIRELRKNKIEAKPLFDLSIAEWMIDSSSGKYSLKDLCEKYLGQEEDERTAIRKIYPILKNELEKKGLIKLFNEMEMPLVEILSKMEDRGIKLDPSKLKDFEEDLRTESSEIEKTVFELCGHEFNLNSPKQLQEVLFVERNLPTIKKTSTGFSTDSDVLEELSYSTEDPVPELLLRYRTINKLLSVYTQNLFDFADENGRIHTCFDQTGTATGRLSSKNPNLQNIPIRTDAGRKIRDAFIPENGCVLLSADYSQIELAVMADLSKDPELCASFINGDDVHKQTASLIFGLFPELITPSQRRIAKTINFGVIYGMSAFRLAHDLKISRKEAAGFIDTYFERYSSVTSFIEKTKRDAEKDLFVKTKMGHIRKVPEIGSVNKNIKAQGERIAVNSVIQGTAAEIVKRAMISISRALEEQNLKSRLLLQVHDEVILEVPKEELALVTELVKKCMEDSAQLSVPLRVGIENALSWGQMH